MRVKGEIRAMQQKPRNTKEAHQAPGPGERPAADSPSQPQKEATLPMPSSRTSSFRDRETTRFCYVSHPGCGTLSWQPEQINTETRGGLLVRAVLSCR